jgi:hypothetical protein
VSFVLKFTPEASATLDDMERDNSYAKKLKKVRKALGYIEVDPRHSGLQSHQYESLHGPNNEPVWESYIENQTPGAWRIWWWYGPKQGEISILAIGPHPD